MAVLTEVTVEEYLSTSYRPDMEYVDGQLVERHAGEYFHSRLQGILSAVLFARERAFRVFISVRVEVRQRRRYRIPDICVKALPHEITPVLTQPDLAIEILSPDDDTADTLACVSDYLNAGTKEVWIADPYKRKLFAADAQGLSRNRRSRGWIAARRKRRLRRDLQGTPRACRLIEVTREESGRCSVPQGAPGARESNPQLSPIQKISFIPSCNWRELPRSPRAVRVAVIVP